MKHWENVGSFETVGELRELLNKYDAETPLGFIHQPKQELFESEHDSKVMLGFRSYDFDQRYFMITEHDVRKDKAYISDGPIICEQYMRDTRFNKIIERGSFMLGYGQVYVAELSGFVKFEKFVDMMTN